MGVRSTLRQDEADRGRRYVAVTAALLLVGAGVAPAGAFAAPSGAAASHGDEAVTPAAGDGANGTLVMHRAVEYGGGIEVVFSENVTRASVRNATVTVDGREVDALVEGYGSYWWFTLNGDVPPHASVRVDFGDVETTDGDVARNVSTEVTATSARLREFGHAATPDDAVYAFRGETVALVADGLNQEVAMRDSEGNLVRRGRTTGRAIALDTTTLDNGEVYEVSFGENRTQYLALSSLDLTATADPSVAEANESVEVTADANHGSQPVHFEVRDGSEVVASERLTLAADGRATFEFTPRSPGNYTATVTDLETGITAATETVTVQPAPDRPTSPVETATPTDPDGDGRYEDLNGNGQIDYADVVAYFDHVGESPLTDHVDAYDYNGNDEIDYADLVALFEQV